MDPQCWKELERLHRDYAFVFAFFVLGWGPGQWSDWLEVTQLFCDQVIIDSSDLEVNPHCSGLCLGGLSIWPNVRQREYLTSWIKAKPICLSLKIVQDSLLFYLLFAFSFISISTKPCLRAFSTFQTHSASKLLLSELTHFEVRVLQCYSSTTPDWLSIPLDGDDWKRKKIFPLEMGTWRCSQDRKNRRHIVLPINGLNSIFTEMCGE